MPLVLEMCPLFVRKYLIILKLVLGDGIRLESRNLLLRSLLVSVVKIWKWFWKCALYLIEDFLIILKLVLGEGIRPESRNMLFSSLLVSVVKIWKGGWKCAPYL